MNIRHTTENDIPEFLLLLAELGYPTSLNDLSHRFKQFLQNKGYGVAVCEINNKVVGFVAWSSSYLFVSNVKRFHIEGIVVDSRHKGSSIGKKLMEFVEDVAKNDSPVIVDLTSGLRRAKDGTHELYKSLVYQNEGKMAKLYLRKEL